MADVIVYDSHAMNMDLGLLREEFDALPDYPQKDFDFQLTLLIAEYANSKGVCWPGMGILATRLHCFKMDVKRGVDRVLKFSVFAIKKAKAKGAKWEHNVYIFAKRFLRKTVDKLASHFDAQKWKDWVEEKMSERQRKKLIRRYCEQTDTDLENAGVYQGHWMAMRYVKKHVGETPEEYDAILAEAIAKYRDYDGPNFREIADRPAKPVAQPVSTPVSTPVEDVSEEDMARMFRMFDEHPELVDDPEQAARLAGVVLPDMKQPAKPEPVDPEPWLEDYDKPVEPVSPVKRETNLEALPANTESASAVGSNTQPIQLDTANAPKFINGEVSSLWTSQQLLHKMNPDMYPAY